MDAGSVNLNTSTATALEGLKKATSNLDQAAQNIAGGSLDPQDVVSLSQAATSFKANAAVLKAADQATQSLLNITA
jgi:flagellar hook-associated protein FlgK